MGNYLTPRSAGPVSAYELSTEPIPGALRGCRVQLYRSSRRGCSPPLSWQDVLHLWSEDSEFNASFSAALAAVSFRDFFWETAPVSGQSMASQPFECVVLDAQGSLINRQASHQDFDEHFARHARQQSSSTAVSFLNLGRDATLVAPMPQGGTSTKAYGSLATFVRDAHPQEQDELWSTVGKVLLRELELSPRRPLWLNTDGRGVPWLHVRLDTQPKYIKFADYESPPSPGRQDHRRSRAPGARQSSLERMDSPDSEASGSRGRYR